MSCFEEQKRLSSFVISSPSTQRSVATLKHTLSVQITSWSMVMIMRIKGLRKEERGQRCMSWEEKIWALLTTTMRFVVKWKRGDTLSRWYLAQKLIQMTQSTRSATKSQSKNTWGSLMTSERMNYMSTQVRTVVRHVKGVGVDKWPVWTVTGSSATGYAFGVGRENIQIRTILRNFQKFALKSQPLEVHFALLIQR